MLDHRYRLGRVLGEGGMACVYLAEDTKLGKAVAVKVLKHEYAAQPRVMQRFTQEARAISRVLHPNVIDVTDHGVTPDRSAYLVMELLHGEDLAATLTREGPLTWARLGPIALQICAALATVHRAGIVHRDIKPSNCFRVRVAGNPDFIKVLDFGIAKVLAGPAVAGAPQSTTGSLLGTPEYMAPELPNGLEADARVDVYALGVLMYKLLTGSAPFTGEAYMAVLARHMFDPVEPPRVRAPGRDIPAPVEAVVLRALAKDRDDRWPDMVALAEAIAQTLPGRPSARLWLEGSQETRTLTTTDRAPPPDPSSPALAEPDTHPRLGPDTLAQPRSRRRLALRLGATTALVVAVVAVWWLAARPEPHVPADMSERTGPKGQDPTELDPSACQLALQPMSAQIRRCASERGVTGAFELQVRVAPDGAASRVEAAPGSPALPAEALACMRGLVDGQRFPASARGGRFRMRFPVR
jgi:serine/threonine protein kinase